MRFLTILFLLSLPLNLSAIEVEEFKSGLACTDGETFGWICHETKDIYVTGQGRCVVNGEKAPCTWYGFEFKYSGNNLSAVIECNYTLSQKADMVNPEKIINTDTDKGTYTFSLDGESGHFFNPQYVRFITQPNDRAISTSKTTCSVGGSKVFEYEFNIHFPVIE